VLYSIKHTYFVGSRVANRAYNSLAPVVPLRVVKFELFKAISGSIAVELKFQLELLRIKTNIRIGILHIVEKTQITFFFKHLQLSGATRWEEK